MLNTLTSRHTAWSRHRGRSLIAFFGAHGFPTWGASPRSARGVTTGMRSPSARRGRRRARGTPRATSTPARRTAWPICVCCAVLCSATQLQLCSARARLLVRPERSEDGAAEPRGRGGVLVPKVAVHLDARAPRLAARHHSIAWHSMAPHAASVTARESGSPRHMRCDATLCAPGPGWPSPHHML